MALSVAAPPQWLAAPTTPSAQVDKDTAKKTLCELEAALKAMKEQQPPTQDASVTDEATP